MSEETICDKLLVAKKTFQLECVRGRERPLDSNWDALPLRRAFLSWYRLSRKAMREILKNRRMGVDTPNEGVILQALESSSRLIRGAVCAVEEGFYLPQSFFDWHPAEGKLSHDEAWELSVGESRVIGGVEYRRVAEEDQPYSCGIYCCGIKTYAVQCRYLPPR